MLVVHFEYFSLSCIELDLSYSSMLVVLMSGLPDLFIRSSLGKPRRLSQRFLQEEREKLEAYRESVRTHYHELRGGLREGLNSDLARPLTVGQRVIAKHRRTKQIHDGSILTVDRNRCRVQFDRPELGVEFVMVG